MVAKCGFKVRRRRRIGRLEAMPLKRGGAEGGASEAQVKVMSPEKRAAARADIVKSIGHELKLESVKDVTDFERDFFAGTMESPFGEYFEHLRDVYTGKVKADEAGLRYVMAHSTVRVSASEGDEGADGSHDDDIWAAS